MYLTYEDYKSYGGTLDKSAFDNFNYRAKVKIDYYTDNKLCNDTEFGEKIKRATAEIVDLLSTYAEYQKIVTNTENPVVSSQSNDGLSVSYGGYIGNTTTSDMQSVSDKLDKDIAKVIRQYLAGETNQSGECLLYRGVY